MTRRITRRKAPAVVTKRQAWGEPFDKLFRLGAAGGWSSPAEVVIRMGSRTWSYVADFVDDSGHVWRSTIRIDPVRKLVLEEKIEARFSMRRGK